MKVFLIVIKVILDKLLLKRKQELEGEIKNEF